MDDNLCNRLEALANEIHTELQGVDQMDEDKRRTLEALQADITAALERCDTPQEPYLLDRLNDAVGEFEVSHPSLTVTIGHVMDILSGSGI